MSPLHGSSLWRHFAGACPHVTAIKRLSIGLAVAVLVSVDRGACEHKPDTKHWRSTQLLYGILTGGRNDHWCRVTKEATSTFHWFLIGLPAAHLVVYITITTIWRSIYLSTCAVIFVCVNTSFTIKRRIISSRRLHKIMKSSHWECVTFNTHCRNRFK